MSDALLTHSLEQSVRDKREQGQVVILKQKAGPVGAATPNKAESDTTLVKSAVPDRIEHPAGAKVNQVGRETKPAAPDKPTGKAAPQQELVPFHPLAEVFPLTEDDELNALADDIAENGQRDLISTYEGKILDGRRRYLACLKVGAEPRFAEYTGDDPVGYVVSKNLHRRNLNASQLALAAKTFLPLYEEEAKKRQVSGKGPNGSGGRGHKKTENQVEKIPQGSGSPQNSESQRQPVQVRGRSRDKVAAIWGVNPRYISDLKIIEKKAPKEIPAIRDGKKTISEVMLKLRPKSKKPRKPAGEKIIKKPSPVLVPKVISNVVKRLSGQQFEIVYAAKSDLTDMDTLQGNASMLLNAVLADEGFFILRGRLDEEVRQSWGRTGLLMALVLETGIIEPNDSFNLDVKHELLMVYSTEVCHMAPPQRIDSLIRCGDPQTLIETWFPAATKLCLASDERREGWTAISSLSRARGEPATELKITKGGGDGAANLPSSGR